MEHLGITSPSQVQLGLAGHLHLGLMVARQLRAAPGAPSVPPLEELSYCFSSFSALPNLGSALHPPLGALRVETGTLCMQLCPGEKAFPLTWEHRPVFLVSELAGASSLVRAAVEPPKRALGAEGRAAKQGYSLAVGSHRFLGVRTAWHDSQPRRVLRWGSGQQGEMDREYKGFGVQPY